MRNIKRKVGRERPASANNRRLSVLICDFKFHGANSSKMAEQATVSDIFRRALEIRRANPTGSYDDVKAALMSEFSGSALPSTAQLTIPEYDNIVPEEDWTAGLPVVLRGIQTEDWKDVVHGIIISLEQIENYPKQSGREDDPSKDWRNRNKGIAEAEDKVLGKWMPEELMAMAKRNVKS
jgi:hypothetical protein